MPSHDDSLSHFFTFFDGERVDVEFWIPRFFHRRLIVFKGNQAIEQF